MKLRLAGIFFLLLLVGVLFMVRDYLKDHETREIFGMVSEEKGGLFENQKVKDILALKYNLKVSLVSPRGDNFNRKDISFIWHGGEYYKTWIVEKEKLSLLKKESIFATFMVFYAWKGSVDNLKKMGLVEKNEQGTLYLDVKKTADQFLSKNPQPRFLMARPGMMTSGLEFMSVLLRFFPGYAGTGTPGENLLKRVGAAARGQGYAFKGESRTFDNFIRTAGRHDAILAAYEHQVIECCRHDKLLRRFFKERLRILYPKIPVWIEHPFLVLKPEGSRLLEAMKDKDIQRIARKSYGWRRAVEGRKNKMKEVKALGIPVLLPRPYMYPEPEIMALLKEELTGK